jgi:hypothetical protein
VTSLTARWPSQQPSRPSPSPDGPSRYSGHLGRKCTCAHNGRLRVLDAVRVVVDLRESPTRISPIRGSILSWALHFLVPLRRFGIRSLLPFSPSARRSHANKVWTPGFPVWTSECRSGVTFRPQGFTLSAVFSARGPHRCFTTQPTMGFMTFRTPPTR